MSCHIIQTLRQKLPQDPAVRLYGLLFQKRRKKKEKDSTGDVFRTSFIRDELIQVLMALIHYLSFVEELHPWPTISPVA